MVSHQSRILQRDKRVNDKRVNDKRVSDDSGRRARTKCGINVILTFMH